MQIAGRRALLTGASGGIGNAIARGLHERGATLVLSGRRADVLEELAGELGEHVEVVPADLSTDESVAHLAASAGAVDILVANAALPGSGRLDDFSPEQIDRTIDVNLRAPMQLARELTPGMVERGAGHLVFISSMSGKIAAGGGSIYSATKFGLRGFAVALRDELHGSGVGVSVVSPGFVSDAGMFADTDIKLPAYVRTRSPRQVAEAVIRAVERNRGDIDVAPFSMRVSGWLAAMAPDLVAASGRRLGSAKVADQLAERQRAKR
ncbi:MAG TPA: SDR family NAD(P)-dependent oxidoreductase [Thermoleophilaceae bacterium]|nr:SDR family NAD(P)-dependent oxidoreductase [Thermoleophilaceae bacterium]